MIGHQKTRRPDKNRSLVWPLDFLFLFIHFFFFHLSSFTRATRENRTHREKNEAREKSLPNHSQIPTPGKSTFPIRPKRELACLSYHLKSESYDNEFRTLISLFHLHKPLKIKLRHITIRF